MASTPEWLRRSEVYGEAIRDWVQLGRYRFDLVTHVPQRPEWISRLREMGSRPVPYITLYQQPMGSTYQGIELRKHTDWIELDEDGAWKRTSFWDTEDQKNWYIVCPNVEGYIGAVLKHVESLMEAGAGGIFVDNVGDRKRCFGPDFGAHQHIHEDQTTAFSSLLGRVRDTIREHEPEGVLLLNSASPETLPDEYWANADADMAESYICTWVSDQRWMDWHEKWNAMGRKVAGKLAAGKHVLALSYLGHTAYPIKDDAYFCYCSAKLSGFLWSAGGDVLRGDPAEVLYSIRLGEPVGPEEGTAGIHHRSFERGVVAVNPEDSAGDLVVPGMDNMEILDLYGERVVGQAGEPATFEVPGNSGRVFLYVPDPRVAEKEPHVLEVSTSPPLGGVRLLVDGVGYYTRSGRWKISYEKGESFGTLCIKYAAPGEHELSVPESEARALEISKGYGSIEKLGDLMDPAEPTRPAGDRGYRFLEWRVGDGPVGRGTAVVRVEGLTRAVAVYEEIKGG